MNDPFRTAIRQNQTLDVFELAASDYFCRCDTMTITHFRLHQCFGSRTDIIRILGSKKKNETKKNGLGTDWVNHDQTRCEKCQHWHHRLLSCTTLLYNWKCLTLATTWNCLYFFIYFSIVHVQSWSYYTPRIFNLTDLTVMGSKPLLPPQCCKSWGLSM